MAPVGAWSLRTWRHVDAFERLLVVAVLDQHEPVGGDVGIGAPIVAYRAWRRKQRALRMPQRALLDPFEAAPDTRIRRVVALRHRIAKVGHPWDTGQAMQCETDQVRGCDRIRRE